MKKLILPLLLTILFVLESVFVDLLPSTLFNVDRLFIPHFVMIALVFIVVYYNHLLGLVYAIIFGLLFDMVYTEIIGVYMFAYPIISYVLTKAVKILQTNIFIISVISIVGVALLEFYVYAVNLIIGFTNMNISLFISDRLFSTLVLNSVFVIIVCYPFKRLLVRLSVTE
ncbi:rod shape-determining protein MreD [Bacillus luteolus]|uniref:Rod shape-determining protein MreD n=1 Tax=Litchfieldia luteola TaxID=682179 RepID=A0ABR9QI19_9BACI|nr:rod shape-determining protein MreD [Cytobacillus luteolus]MBE4908141.1 rod shape-determining protein MreD [Cytobacillus luteolus]MBP1942926.1 rod shape-determining protein MreD [Cytobacillus luteolus]